MLCPHCGQKRLIVFRPGSDGPATWTGNGIVMRTPKGTYQDAFRAFDGGGDRKHRA